MSDYFQTFVDLDARRRNAADLAELAVQWMADEGIISATRTKCVFGQDLGYPPGPNWDKIVEGADKKPTDGLEVKVGRATFSVGRGTPTPVTCPRCKATTVLATEAGELIDEAWRPFRAAMTAWEETTGRADVTCPACQATVPLPEWWWDENYFVFGYLGFTFWNWPKITEDFLWESEALQSQDITWLDGRL